MGQITEGKIMSRNSDLKAIGWYAVANGYKPEMSPWPVIHFTRRSDGELIKVNVTNIVAQYQRAKEEEKKAAAREARNDRK